MQVFFIYKLCKGGEILADDFKIPEFIQNQDVESILARMFNVLPETISKEENGWISDLFTPVAIELSRAANFVLIEAIKNIIPKYSYGDILLGHAENRGIFKRPASNAKAILTIKGVAGTVIPKGYQFSTSSTLDNAGIVFSTDEEYTISEEKQIEVKAACISAGKIGNVAAETIVLMVKPLKGIVSVVNNSAAYGGFEEESEESLKKRIEEYDLMQGQSFVGSASDYRRWAMEVEGVGNAIIISAGDDTGTVTIILSDLNGQPVSNDICNNVYNHIMRPDSLYERLAPVNALLNVISAKELIININAKVILEDNYTLEMIKPLFLENLKQYLKTDDAHNVVRYSEIGAALVNTEGVADYESLKLNDDIVNVKVDVGYVPLADEVSVVLIE